MTLLARNLAPDSAPNAAQLRLDALLHSSCREASNAENIIAMGVGAGAYRLFQGLGLSFAGGQGSRYLLKAAALGSEVSAYRATRNSLEILSGRNPQQAVFDAGAWRRNFTDFLAFRLLGSGMRSTQSFALTHASQSALAVALRQVQDSGSSQTTLFEQFAESAALGFAQIAGQRLFSLASVNRTEVMERSLQISLQIKTAPIRVPPLQATQSLQMQAQKPSPRLVEVNTPADILPPYRNTPIEQLLLYHNLGHPFRDHANAELILGLCMDARHDLRTPRNFAYELRAAGANLRDHAFDIAVAVGGMGVKHAALIGHSQCAMQGILSRRETVVQGLVDNAGWSRTRAEEFFDQHAVSREIGDAIAFTRFEAQRWSQRFNGLQVAPLYYRVEDHRLLQIVQDP